MANNIIVSFACAVIETAREMKASKQPCPLGPLYLGAQQHKIDYNTFMQIIDILVRGGKIKRASNNCIEAV